MNRTNANAVRWGLALGGVAFIILLALALGIVATAQRRVPCDAFLHEGSGIWTATRQMNVDGAQGSYEFLPGQMAGPDVVSRLEKECR